MSARTRTICLWGATGSSKTSQLYHRIKRMYERTGKTCRAVYADGGGGSPLIDYGLVDAGIVDLWDISDRADNAMSTVKNIAEGYWYRVAKTGERVIRKNDLFRTTKAEWDQIGLVAFEGGSSIAQLIARGMANSEGKKRGFDKAFHYKEGAYDFGGISMYHIGMIQNHIFDLVVNARASMDVDEIIWTFHDGKGEEANTKSTKLAPDIIGNKMNTKLGKEFWDQLHLCHEDVLVDYQNGKEPRTERRIVCYFQDHMDITTGIPCMAKVRVLPELFPRLLEKWPNGGVVMDFNNGVNELYDFLDKLKDEARIAGRVWFENASTGYLRQSGTNGNSVNSLAMGALPNREIMEESSILDTEETEVTETSDDVDLFA